MENQMKDFKGWECGYCKTRHSTIEERTKCEQACYDKILKENIVKQEELKKAKIEESKAILTEKIKKSQEKINSLESQLRNEEAELRKSRQELNKLCVSKYREDKPTFYECNDLKELIKFLGENI